MAQETQAFEVIVSVTGDITNQNVAIAEGVRYLAEGCSDFRETGDPFEIHAYDEHLKQMMGELTDMKRVETVEKLMYA